jgi:uncharacterized membrane protein
MQSQRRTIVKAMLWTLLGLFSMTLVGWAFTGSITVGTNMSICNSLAGFATYFLYESIWDKVPWGREND